MIKTFEVVFTVYQSYRGNGIKHNPDWCKEIDEQINDFLSKGLKRYKIDSYFPSFVSKKQQFGRDELYAETTVYFIVLISYHEVQN